MAKVCGAARCGQAVAPGLVGVAGESRQAGRAAGVAEGALCSRAVGSYRCIAASWSIAGFDGG